MKQLMKVAMLLSVLVMGSLLALAQGPQGGHANGSADRISRDPLNGLKRAITTAGAPALTAQQETDIKALITAYRDALPDEEDAALAAAKDAYDAALAAGNLTAAQTAAGQIAARQAVLSAQALTDRAKFVIAVLANLRTGSQLPLLIEKFTAERVVEMVQGLVHGGGGGRGR